MMSDTLSTTARPPLPSPCNVAPSFTFGAFKGRADRAADTWSFSTLQIVMRNAMGG